MNEYRDKTTAKQLCDTLYRELNASVLVPDNYANVFPYEEDGLRFQVALASVVENYTYKFVMHEHSDKFEDNFAGKLADAIVERFKASPVETCLAHVSFYPSEKAALCELFRGTYRDDSSDNKIYGSRAPLWIIFDLLRKIRCHHFMNELRNAHSSGLAWPVDAAIALTICAPFWVFGGTVQSESEVKYFGHCLLETADICRRACTRLL